MKGLLFCTTFVLLVFYNAAFSEEQPRQLQTIAEFRYFGTCDGSAAIMISDDTMLVANDETNELKTYRIMGGLPIHKFNVEPLLSLKTDREIDIEAVARQKDKLWWVGSHSRNRKAKKRSNRRKIFATNIPSIDLTDLNVSVDSDKLYTELKNSPLLEVYFNDDILDIAPKLGGLNIEGLAARPGGGLLLGLRAPLAGKDGEQGEAIVVAANHLGDDDWEIEEVFKLDLDDRGIRDIVPHRDGFMIIAGNVDSDRRTSLYFWNGSTKPTSIEIDLDTGLNPEAILKFNNYWLVLSDDGTQERGTSKGWGAPQCKDLQDQDPDNPNVFFRGVLLSQ